MSFTPEFIEGIASNIMAYSLNKVQKIKATRDLWLNYLINKGMQICL
jgi:hypothetical protein